MNKNLIIGNTSQLSYYFPETADKISSRDIDLENIKSKKYDKIFLTFGEQRTYLTESEEFFIDVNFKYTIRIIDELKNML
jgi:hypothetical protein